MTPTSQAARDALDSDMVSYAELRLLCATTARDSAAEESDLRLALLELLRADVEIGYARDVRGEYVKFVAWGGTEEARIERAFKEVAHWKRKEDADFAWWLCLTTNIDEREETAGRDETVRTEQDGAGNSHRAGQ